MLVGATGAILSDQALCKITTGTIERYATEKLGTACSSKANHRATIDD
jgi:hypothetical protein